MRTLYRDAQALLPHMIDIRRRIHAHAEGGYALPHTLNTIRSELEDMGISWREPALSTTVCEIGKGRPNIVLRADTDALPMTEANKLDFQSETDFAHTCGHDCHTAMLLGAARLLKAREKELPGRVMLLFQPDEEGATGARTVAKSGILDGWHGAYALHMDPQSESGALYTAEGPMFASADELTITVRGRSAHGASPADGADPIFAAVEIYNTLQGLMSRERPLDQTAVLSVCMFHSGEIYNLVPETAEMQGTFRTYNESLRARFIERMRTITESVGTACNVQAQFDNWQSLPAVINDPALTRALCRNLKEVLPGGTLRQLPGPFSWSEDFSVFGALMPITMMTLGANVPGCTGNLHNADVLFDETSFSVGAAALAAAAFTSPE